MKARLAAVLLILAAAGLVLVAGCGGSGGGNGHGSMMRYGPGMMGYGPIGSGEAVRNLDQARRQAQRFADRLDLGVGEVMRFTRNFYAELNDPTGKGATEVLVNPATGAVWLEYGPAMMWNTRYGMMGGRGYGGMMGGGMMGGGPYGDPTWGPGGRPVKASAVSPAEAETIADDWLAAQGTGLRAGEAEPFPGYYTLHTLRNGRVTGMLSVNAYTGAVWYHWWHGRFLGMEE